MAHFDGALLLGTILGFCHLAYANQHMVFLKKKKKKNIYCTSEPILILQ